MAKVHDRILEINFSADTVGHKITVNNVNYYRNRSRVEDSLPFALVYSPATAQASPAEIQMGELVPPPTVIRFVFTGI